MLVCEAVSVVSDSLPSHGLQPAKLLCPWDSPGKNTGLGCMPSSRGFSQPGERTCMLHCRQFFTSETPGETFWCVDTAFWKADRVIAKFPYAPPSPVGQWFCSKRWGISLFKGHLDIRFNNSWAGDFPGGPVVKTTHFQCRGQVCNPWLGNLVARPKENTQKSKKKKTKKHHTHKKTTCWAVWTCRCSWTSLDFSCHQ